MWCFVGGLPALPSHPCAHIFKSLESNFLCPAFLELSYVCCQLFFTHLLLSATFTVYYLCLHFTHTLTIVFYAWYFRLSRTVVKTKKREGPLVEFEA